MRLPTFSSVALAMECGASAVLPWTDKPTNAGAIRGTKLHAELYDLFTKDKPASFNANAILDFVGNAYRCEVGLAYNPDTEDVVELGDNIGRSYADNAELLAAHYCGSLDVCSVNGDTALVVDFKTGKSDGDVWQLRAQSVAWAKNVGLRNVRSCFAYLREGFNEVILGEIYHWDSLDLAGFADELLQLKQQLQGSPTPREGEHCRYCKSYAHCPAKANLAVHLGRASITTDWNKIIITPEIAATGWEALIQGEQLLKHVRERLEGYARQTPFMLSDGSVVQEVPDATKRSELNGEIAYTIIERECNAETARECCPPKSSQVQIERVLGKPLAKAIIATIEAAGGIERKSYPAIKAVKPKKLGK